MKDGIETALKEINNQLPTNTTLVAVSKTKSVEEIMSAYRCGQRHFGENKVQEFLLKYNELPNDILWHFIGHLQTKKVKSLIGLVHLIHSVDSLKLLDEINKRSAAKSVSTNCLLQVHIAEEDTKFGFSPDELKDMHSSKELESFQHVSIKGLMGMASNSPDEHKVKNEFARLFNLYQHLKNRYYSAESSFQTLSMGMTSDYLIALKEGSNMVRIGSLIFGDRT